MGSSVYVKYFEGEVKCHFLNIGVKSTNEWIVYDGKVCFAQIFS
jgi:hypothetical protein